MKFLCTIHKIYEGIYCGTYVVEQENDRMEDILYMCKN